MVREKAIFWIDAGITETQMGLFEKLHVIRCLYPSIDKEYTWISYELGETQVVEIREYLSVEWIKATLI